MNNINKRDLIIAELKWQLHDTKPLEAVKAFCEKYAGKRINKKLELPPHSYLKKETDWMTKSNAAISYKLCLHNMDRYDEERREYKDENNSFPLGLVVPTVEELMQENSLGYSIEKNNKHLNELLNNEQAIQDFVDVLDKFEIAVQNVKDIVNKYSFKMIQTNVYKNLGLTTYNGQHLF